MGSVLSTLAVASVFHSPFLGRLFLRDVYLRQSVQPSNEEIQPVQISLTPLSAEARKCKEINLLQVLSITAEDVAARCPPIGMANSTLSASNAINSYASRKSAAWNASGS
jgi:hypothetical protein